MKIISQNKKVRFNYHLEQLFEAGIVLKGSEVKSARAGKCNINDAIASENKGELFLLNSYIEEYTQANRFNHSPRRPRKLLLNKSEIKKIIGKIREKGYTVVATKLYFNDKNRLKVEIALARGKKKYDKREDIKLRDTKREMQRMMKGGVQ